MACFCLRDEYTFDISLGSKFHYPCSLATIAKLMPSVKFNPKTIHMIQIIVLHSMESYCGSIMFKDGEVYISITNP